MSETINKKRERGANYTAEEKSLLIDLIMQFKHIIEDKSTGGHIINKKKEAWKEITIKYNSHSTTGCRQPDQLKALYDNMKQKSRKSVGENNKKEYILSQNGQRDYVSKEDVTQALQNIKEDKVQMHKTGGGFWKPKTTDNDAKIYSLIQEQVEPLSNPYDSGAVYFKDKPMEVDIQTPNLEITTTQADFTGSIFELPKEANYGDLFICSPSIIQDNAPTKSTLTPTQDQQSLSEKMLLLSTPSRAVNLIPKKLKNKVVTKKVNKPKTAEAYKRIYFKKKAENASLERRKILNEILNQKKEHNLKMILLKKQIDNLNK